MKFKEKLLEAAQTNKSWLCVGLDPDLNKLPGPVEKSVEGIEIFLKNIIDTTKDLVCAYKPNSAFYEQFGAEGITLLKEVITYIPDNIPVILDAKRGDIGNTSRMYAITAFESLGADAITVHPYMGIDSVGPFIDYEDKGVFILCLTSNPSSGDFQKQVLDSANIFYKLVAQTSLEWNKNDNIGLVVGATKPGELKDIRKLIGQDIPLLIPGIGAQGGDLQESLKSGANANGQLAIINASRSVLYASVEQDYPDKSRDEAFNLVSAMRSILNLK